MKEGLIELVFILDKSGSMAGLESDTIGGYNSFLEKQRDVDGEALITTVLFNQGYHLLHDRIDLQAVSKISEREYYVGGTTALLDAIGRTINKIAGAQKNTAEDFRAEKVMFVIITDGFENASREFSSGQVKALIEREKEQYGWEFVFLGANIDAVETARQYGIDADRAQNYHADKKGSKVVYQTLACAAATFRSAPYGDRLATGSFEPIEVDYQKRK